MQLFNFYNIHDFISITHWGLNRMVFDISKCIFFSKIICLLIQISMNIISKGAIVNTSVLDQVRACYLMDNKLLPEPILTKMSDDLWHHKATMS